ncbi:hypothetical protein [Sandarakinorhabdus sp.]|uniref:hypothetical protein n=1 Tax=Sandarakinorhabdus sp. TaxID=1916663 RepID=UPI00286E0554|nr:hypothetical protein [Sandarakinorhabdus sp.]
MEVLGLFFFWFILAAAADWIASDKGRSGCGFQLFALLLPLIALIVALALTPDRDHLNEKAIKRGKKSRCPACREAIDPEATICPFCRSDIVRPPSELSASFRLGKRLSRK